MGWGKRPALLIIDVCRGYFAPGSPLDLKQQGAAVPDSVRRLLSTAREHGLPVFWTVVEYTDPSMAEAGLFWSKSKSLDLWHVDDTRGYKDFVEGIEPARGDCVVKKFYASGFFGTGQLPFTLSSATGS